MNKLSQVINTAKIPYLVCIGTDLSYIDGIAPRLGSKLKNDYRVLGTVGDNLDNVTVKERAEEIEAIDSAVYQVIALDCAFHHDYHGTERLVIYEEGLKPSSYLGRKNRVIGEIGVGINVSPAVSSLQEFLTPKKRQDIYEIELQIEIYLLKLLEQYSLPMRIAIMMDLEYTEPQIRRKLKLTKDEYKEELEKLKNINNFIYERMV